MSTQPPILVQLSEVGKTYGDHMVTALSSINLSIERGEFLAIMGPSGCGKSTLLNIIGGIDRPTAGQVFFEGENILGYSDEKLTALRRRNVGFVFQFFNLLSTLTVEENVALPLELEHVAAKEVRQAVAQSLESVDMTKRARFYPAQLSGGEMQRVAIARALIHAPKVVIADEPTGNLDTENGETVLQLIAKINREQGRTIVMATHSPDAAARASRLLQMRDGCITGEQKCCPRP